jgi:hypothetical protein
MGIWIKQIILKMDRKTTDVKTHHALFCVTSLMQILRYLSSLTRTSLSHNNYNLQAKKGKKKNQEEQYL